jgi:hypothetical protein
MSKDPALKPVRESDALALPLVTVPEVTECPSTLNVTVPLLTAGPLAGVTVAVSVTEESPKVAVLLCATVVVLTVPDVTTSVMVVVKSPFP